MFDGEHLYLIEPAGKGIHIIVITSPILTILTAWKKLSVN